MAKRQDPGVPGRKALKRILDRKGIEAYGVELMKPWATMEEDMLELVRLVAAAQEREGGSLAFMGDIEVDADGNLSTTLPEWMMEVMEHFREKYGEEAGGVVYEKAMALFMDRILPREDPGEGVSVEVPLEAIVKRRQ